MHVGANLPEAERNQYIEKSPNHRDALLLAAVDSDLGCPQPELAIALIEQGADYLASPKKLAALRSAKEESVIPEIRDVSALGQAIEACPASVLQTLKAKGAKFDRFKVQDAWSRRISFQDHVPAVVVTLETIARCPNVTAIDGPFQADADGLLNPSQVAMRSCVEKTGDRRLCMVVPTRNLHPEERALGKPQPRPSVGAPGPHVVLLFTGKGKLHPGCSANPHMLYHSIVRAEDPRGSSQAAKINEYWADAEGMKLFERRPVVIDPPPPPSPELLLRVRVLTEGVPVSKDWLESIAHRMVELEHAGRLDPWSETFATLIANSEAKDRISVAVGAHNSPKTGALLEQGLDVSGDWTLTNRRYRAAFAAGDLDGARSAAATLIAQFVADSSKWSYYMLSDRRSDIEQIVADAIKQPDSVQLQWLMDNGFESWATVALGMTRDLSHTKVLIAAGARPAGVHLALAIDAESAPVFEALVTAGASVQSKFQRRKDHRPSNLHIPEIAYTLLDVLDDHVWRDPTARTAIEGTLAAAGVQRTPPDLIVQWEALYKVRLDALIAENDRRARAEEREERRRSLERQARWKAEQLAREQKLAAEKDRERAAARESERRREARRSGSGSTVDVAGALNRALGDGAAQPAYRTPARTGGVTSPPAASANGGCRLSDCNQRCKTKAPKCEAVRFDAAPPATIRTKFDAALVHGSTDVYHAREAAENLARVSANVLASEACQASDATLESVKYWYMKCEANRTGTEVKCGVDATPHCIKRVTNPAYTEHKSNVAETKRRAMECEKSRRADIDLCEQLCSAKCR